MVKVSISRDVLDIFLDFYTGYSVKSKSVNLRLVGIRAKKIPSQAILLEVIRTQYIDGRFPFPKYLYSTSTTLWLSIACSKVTNGFMAFSL